MLQVTVEDGSLLQFTDPKSRTSVAVTFQRTLRIPDDGKIYPLPPGLGAFPVRRVHAYKDRVPASWVKTSGVFIPMYQREALWISVRARHWRPNAVKIAAGKVNAVSGKPWDQALHAPEKPGLIGRVKGDPELQDYLTCPPQPWLDGFNTGEGNVRQFVAMPLGMGYTVEAQVTGKEEHGGLQLIVYEPKPGRFPETPPQKRYVDSMCLSAPRPSAMPRSKEKAGREMGLAAGGAITQKIYPDPHGVDTWDETNFGRVFVHIVNSMMWREITGEEPPPTPVTAQSYTQAGYPWFKLYDESSGDVAPSPTLSGVKSVAQMDAQHGFVGVDDDSTVEVPDKQIKGLPVGAELPDGEW
ncbi:hypothetical protein [Zavarzinella formosa]|uniref:hypothetical protein n=1 Tax=Zavarzinella formosa TaxID=360055 RepID=UPI0006962934|nr:hypothetical protein [Zavarzinella formosa]